MKEDILNRVLRLKKNLGIQIVCSNNSKVPIHSGWTKQALTFDEIKQNSSRSNFAMFGLVTGGLSDGLEVIDVDTKVLKDETEKKEFVIELLSFLNDNIEDLFKKVAIYSTKTGGLHILYKTDSYTSSQKLAYPSPEKTSTKYNDKGEEIPNKEALIETRGGKVTEDGEFSSGYVVFYPDFHNKGLTYEQIKKISDKDRDTIIKCCIALSHKPIEKAVKTATPYVSSDSGDSTWNEYNQKTTVWELISSDFEHIRDLRDKTIIKRIGATSEHSGYIYKDTGCLYLFSTGTIFPAEQLLSPFAVYAYKYHSGDFSEAARVLYSKGYGKRLEAPKIDIKEDVKVIESNDFPLSIFPDEVRFYIEENVRVLGLIPDFMACSFLWAASCLMGNSYKIRVKNGWTESASIWIGCVAKAGVGKTPSINAVIKPLNKINSNEVKTYKKKLETYLEYQNKTNKEKELCDEVSKPVNKQFIANDVTLEALVDLHSMNPNGVSVYKDELAGWLLDMNKYREGSDLQFWLSSWNGETYSSNRKSSGVTLVEDPFIPVIGGIQPAILSSMTNEERKDSGFMDRILLSYPDATVNEFNMNELDPKISNYIDWYIKDLKDKTTDFIRQDFDGNIIPSFIEMSKEALIEFSRISNEITDIQNNEGENEYIKSIYPKMKTYLARFTLICHFLTCSIDKDKDYQKATKDSVLNAEKLVKYFVANAIKIKQDSSEKNKIKKVLDINRKSVSNTDKIISIIESGVDFSNKELAAELGVSKQYVGQVIKKYNDKS